MYISPTCLEEKQSSPETAQPGTCLQPSSQHSSTLAIDSAVTHRSRLSTHALRRAGNAKVSGESTTDGRSKLSPLDPVPCKRLTRGCSRHAAFSPRRPPGSDRRTSGLQPRSARKSRCSAEVMQKDKTEESEHLKGVLCSRTIHKYSRHGL